MERIFTVSQIVQFRREWLNPGEAQTPYIVTRAFPDSSDSNRNYYYVSPIFTSMTIIPTERALGEWLEPCADYVLSAEDQAEWNKHIDERTHY